MPTIIKRYDALCAITLCATTLCGATLSATDIKSVTISAVAVSASWLSATNISGASFRWVRGSFDEAFGTEALCAEDTGNSNVAFGYRALYQNNSGVQNAAFGREALQANTGGLDNVAIGFRALNTPIAQTENTALGTRASQTLTAGGANVAVGCDALQNQTSGGANVAIGDNAGRFLDGTNSLLRTKDSIYIGATSRGMANDDSNQIVIGASAQGSGSNTVVLGNTTISATYLRGVAFSPSISANGISAITISAGTLCGAAVTPGQTATNIVKLSASALAWDDIRVPGLTITISANPPSLGTLSGNLLVYQFDGVGAAADQCYFSVQLPHDYKLGTNLHPHVHYCKSNTTTGDVVWALEYSIAISGASFPATTSISAIDNPGASTMHRKLDFGDIDGSGLTIVSAMLVGRLWRPAADANDTYEADANFLEFDLHYQKDGFGSDTELTKSY